MSAPLTLPRFLARTFAFAVATFALSWLALQPISQATGTVAARLLESVSPVNDARVKARGSELTFEVAPSTWAGRDAVLEATSRGMMYVAGLPLFVALMLASMPRGIAWKLPAGFVLLVVLAALGIWCDVRLQLTLAAGPRGEWLMPLHGMAKEALAVAYQFTLLIVPTLAPVLAWAAFDLAAVGRLARR